MPAESAVDDLAGRQRVPATGSPVERASRTAASSVVIDGQRPRIGLSAIEPVKAARAMMTEMPSAESETSDQARAVASRRLQVVVGSLPIEDGSRPPPAVGRVARLTLIFVEAEEDASNPSVGTVRARAESLGDGTPLGAGQQWDGTPNDGPVIWPTLLHGDGWSATWSAPRPVIDEVKLTGQLIDNLNIDARIHTRGLVTRVQVVTETIDTSDPDRNRWRPIPDQDRLRDVDVAPRWFDDGMVLPPAAQPDAATGGFYFSARVPDDPWVREVGVLVDLDLDNVPPPPPRPHLVPGALAAHRADLWVLDERLPLLLRVRGALTENPEVAEFGWPGRILSDQEAALRALHADASGCWITGPDGVHHAYDDTGVVELDTRSTSALVREGVFAAVETDDPEPGSVGRDRRCRLRRWTYHGREQVDLDDLDLGEGYVEGLVENLDGGFLALRRHLPRDVPLVAHRQQTWLTAVAPDGAVTHGPHLEIAGSLYSPLLAGEPPIVDDSRACGNGALRRTRADLTVDDGVASRRMLLGGYATAGRLWVLAHPPHPDDIARRGTDACWPLGAPPSYPEDRQYWLLTELDPANLQPLISHLVPHHPRHLAVDDQGTVWLLADGLRHLPPHDGATAQPLTLEPLITSTYAPTSP